MARGGAVGVSARRAADALRAAGLPFEEEVVVDGWLVDLRVGEALVELDGPGHFVTELGAARTWPDGATLRKREALGGRVVSVPTLAADQVVAYLRRARALP